MGLSTSARRKASAAPVTTAATERLIRACRGGDAIDDLLEAGANAGKLVPSVSFGTAVHWAAYNDAVDATALSALLRSVGGAAALTTRSCVVGDAFGAEFDLARMEMLDASPLVWAVCNPKASKDKILALLRAAPDRDSWKAPSNLYLECAGDVAAKVGCAPAWSAALVEFLGAGAEDEAKIAKSNAAEKRAKARANRRQAATHGRTTAESVFAAMGQFFLEDDEEAFVEALDAYLASNPGSTVDDVFAGDKMPRYRFVKRVTLAWYAALDTHPECLRVLLERGADPQWVNEEGYSVLDKALDVALRYARNESLDYVRERGGAVADLVGTAETKMVNIQISKIAASQWPAAKAREVIARAFRGELHPEELPHEMSYGKNVDMLTRILKERFRLPEAVAFESFCVHPEGIPRSSHDNVRRALFDAIQPDDVVFFVSHRWLRPDATPAHPDNEEKSKHAAIVEAISRISRETFPGKNIWMWVDYSCIDQDNRLEAVRGIMSLPLTVLASDAFLALVSPDYSSRAWCLSEVSYAATGFIPQFFASVPSGELVTPPNVGDDIDPRTGSLTVQDDRPLIDILFHTMRKIKTDDGGAVLRKRKGAAAL